MDEEDMELLDENCCPDLPVDVTPVSSSENIAPTGRRAKRVHPLICNICNRDLDHTETSTSHIADVHMDQSFFDCSLCPFRSRAGFQGIYGHMKGVHKNVDADVACNRISYMAEVAKWTSTCFDKFARNFRMKRSRLEEIFKENEMSMDVEEGGGLLT